MEEDALWGVVITAWVIIAAVPYLYATVLTMLGKEAASNRIIDVAAVPWGLSFGGLLALWGFGAKAWLAIMYSVAVVTGAIGWATWQLIRRKKKNPATSPSSQTKEISGDQKMLMSKPQRYVLAIAAALIGAILFAQIGEDGLDDSPWMIGLLVIVGLLLLAFAPSRE